MVESHSLKLAMSTANISEHLICFATHKLKLQGFEGVTPTVLNFLGSLECDKDNHASEIARQLNVSRQMVAKTVQELCRLGYVEQNASGGVRKQIRFTEKGEHLMSAARKVFALLDETMHNQLGLDELIALNESLIKLNNALIQALANSEKGQAAC